MKKETKTAQIYCRITQEEKDLIMQECEKLGLSLSNYIRLKLGIGINK